MPTTVYFATNRIVRGDPREVASYSSDIVAADDPAQLTFGVAFVDGIDLASNAQGAITMLSDVTQGGFGPSPAGDLADAGRNLCLFVHGFDNSFSDALTRAAFNREWLAASGQAFADMTMIALSWPSLGQLIGFPVPWDDYQRDQAMARSSGPHIMRFLAAIEPVLTRARQAGRRVCLLAHSMGHLALGAGVDAWFANGNGDARLFDRAVLAAADEQYDAFGDPGGRLRGLRRLADRVLVLYSGRDDVLKLSDEINGVRRLGQNGAFRRDDAALFPPSVYDELDCSDFDDYARDFMTSHQYYRLSPGVRGRIATAVAS